MVVHTSKSPINHFLAIIINGSVFCVVWIVGVLISNAMMGINPQESSDQSTALLLMWLCCLLEAGALHLYLSYNRFNPALRALLVFACLFLIHGCYQ